MDAKQVWRAALGELQVSLSPANYETWLKDTALVAVDDTLFRVAVPSGFAKDWLESRYRSLISQTLARVVGYSVNLEFEVREVARLLPVEWEAAGARTYPISIRVDEDVLDYFKGQGAGYQKRINAVLRSYMNAARKGKKRA